MYSDYSYEPGMTIAYDAERKIARVTFRGRTKMLGGPFSGEEEAREAGEIYCRDLGWKPPGPDAPPNRANHERRVARQFI